MLGVSQSRGIKLFGREIIFEEFQPICTRYLNVTDRQTDGRLTVASPRSALASRGKNLNDPMNCLQNMQAVHKQCTDCTDDGPFGWGNGTVDTSCPTLQQHPRMHRRSASVLTEQTPLQNVAAADRLHKSRSLYCHPPTVTPRPVQCRHQCH